MGKEHPDTPVPFRRVMGKGWAGHAGTIQEGDRATRYRRG